MIRQMWETSVVGKRSRKTRKKNKSSDTSEWKTKQAVRAETADHHTSDAHQRHLTQLFDSENMATLGREERKLMHGRKVEPYLHRREATNGMKNQHISWT